MTRLQRLPRKIIHQLAYRSEQAVDRTWGTIAPLWQDDSALAVQGYAGHQTHEHVHLMARVLRSTRLSRELIEEKRPQTSWEKFRAMARLYNSHEAAGIPVLCRFGDEEHVAKSDEEGYVTFKMPAPAPLSGGTAWESARMRIAHIEGARTVEVPVMVPGGPENWAIISDIDDTILETGATSLLRNIRRTLLNTAEDRVPVEGAPELYRHFHGQQEKATRPFFYVSSSPWNLYPLITEFMRHQNIPAGPIFLRDLGIDRHKFIKGSHGNHKGGVIEALLESYPDRKFLLVGDSGQHDIQIYTDMAKRNPAQVKGILIRDVENRCARPDKAALLEQAKADGTTVHCVPDYGDMVAVLAALGFDKPEEIAASTAPVEPIAAEPNPAA